MYWQDASKHLHIKEPVPVFKETGSLLSKNKINKHCERSMPLFVQLNGLSRCPLDGAFECIAAYLLLLQLLHHLCSVSYASKKSFL